MAIGCTYNNTSRIDISKSGEFKRVGEPTEAALKVFAEKLLGTPKDIASAFSFDEKIKKQLTTIAQLDFTSERKAMSTVVSGHVNKLDTLLKGAPDRVLKKCTNFMSIQGGVTPMSDGQ